MTWRVLGRPTTMRGKSGVNKLSSQIQFTNTHMHTHTCTHTQHACTQKSFGGERQADGGWCTVVSPFLNSFWVVWCELVCFPFRQDMQKSNVNQASVAKLESDSSPRDCKCFCFGFVCSEFVSPLCLLLFIPYRLRRWFWSLRPWKGFSSYIFFFCVLSSLLFISPG